MSLGVRVGPSEAGDEGECECECEYCHLPSLSVKAGEILNWEDLERLWLGAWRGSWR